MSSTTTNGVLKVFYTPVALSGNNFQFTMTGGNATLSASTPSTFTLENNIVNLEFQFKEHPTARGINC